MIFKMAFRNLRRHRAKTILTVAAIGLGTGLALFSIGLGDGSHFQMIENGVRVGQGHLTVQREGFLEAPSTSLYITDPAAWIRTIGRSEHVRKIYPRIRGEGILATAAGAEGVMFQGIDPTLPGEVQIFRDSLTEGEFPADRKAAGIVMGAKLADRLKLKLGKKVVLTTQDAEGEITSTLLRVKGIFRSGSSSIDGSICIIPLGHLQKALDMGDGVTSLAVYLYNPFKQDEAFEEISSMDPPRRWKALHMADPAAGPEGLRRH